ncbi:MAG: hypothetical protein ABIL75_05420, partial [candidate division WOR-3 bacterium]
VTSNVMERIKEYDEKLLEIIPPAEIIIKSSGEYYNIKDYVADIIQFLSCEEISSFLKKEISLTSGL